MFREQPSVMQPAATEQDARERLRILDEVVANREAHAPPAALLWLQLLNGVLVAAFAGVLPFALKGPMPVSMLLVIPLLVTTGLIGGARERFDVRRGPSKFQWVALMVGFAGFLAVMVYTVLFEVTPLRVAAGSAVVLFLGVAMRPVLDLRKAYATSERSRMLSAALSPPARRTTIIIGAGLGFLVALAPFSLAASIASTGLIVLSTLAIVSQASPWSLHWVGFEWGVTQWTAFWVSVTVLFAVAVVTLQQGHVSPVVTIVAGCGIFAIMTLASARKQPSER